jgi:hypothetical protein
VEKEPVKYEDRNAPLFVGLKVISGVHVKPFSINVDDVVASREGY